MDTTELELELLDLEAIYERTKNKVTKAELADKISKKKREIQEQSTLVAEKNVVPQLDAPSRMDHTEVKRTSGFMTNGSGTFSAMI